jgi:hypothetical protein
MVAADPVEVRRRHLVQTAVKKLSPESRFRIADCRTEQAEIAHAMRAAEQRELHLVKREHLIEREKQRTHH